MTFGTIRPRYSEIPIGWNIQYLAVNGVWQGIGPRGEVTAPRPTYEAALQDVQQHVAKQHAPLTDGPSIDVGRDPR